MTDKLDHLKSEIGSAKYRATDILPDCERDEILGEPCVEGAMIAPNSSKMQANAMQLLNVAPNPVKDIIQINISNNCVALNVFDINGRFLQSIALQQIDSYTIDTAVWQNGIYFVEAVFSNAVRKTSKFVIVH